MKVQLFSLSLLAAAHAVAGTVNEYMTDDEELFHLLNVPSFLGDFKEDTKHLTWDNEGLTLDSVLFHANNTLVQNDFSDDEAAAVGHGTLLGRKSGVNCVKPACQLSGPQFLNTIQEGQIGHMVCPLLSRYGSTHKTGSVSVLATGAACHAKSKCTLAVAISYSFNAPGARPALIKSCKAQITKMVRKCDGAPVSQNCYSDGTKDGMSIALSASTTYSECTNRDSTNQHCKKIKCDAKNNNCQSF